MSGHDNNATLAGESLDLPPSLWADTAIAAPPLAPLVGRVDTDVVIVGAGFTGLASAIHLAEAGLRCIVVDAAQPGWGASGRNNGHRTRVLAIDGTIGDFTVTTSVGTAHGKHVIVATGAYAARLVPHLARSFVAVRTAQVATRPLPDTLRRAILPMGNVASDTRQLLTSFRQSPDGRLVMGGSGATAGLDHTKIVPYLQRAGEELFGKLDWRYAWSGYFAVTTDHLPHLHEPQPGLHVSPWAAMGAASRFQHRSVWNSHDALQVRPATRWLSRLPTSAVCRSMRFGRLALPLQRATSGYKTIWAIESGPRSVRLQTRGCIR